LIASHTLSSLFAFSIAYQSAGRVVARHTNNKQQLQGNSGRGVDEKAFIYIGMSAGHEPVHTKIHESRDQKKPIQWFFVLHLSFLSSLFFVLQVIAVPIDLG
jgi:hypothetical protein